MPKKGFNISMVAVIRIIVFLFLGFLLFSGYARMAEFLRHDPMFTVNDVLIESSIQFINTKPLVALKGQNIFAVDVKTLELRLASQYPQISHLRVIRELPDKIKILAKRRDMLFQLSVKNKYVLVDSQGIAVIYSKSPMNMPTVVGFKDSKKIKLGRPIDDTSIHAVGALMVHIRKLASLNKLTISSVDISNPAKISLIFKELPLKIFFDREQAVEKLDTLDILVTQRKLDLLTTDYVDLRFEQPVIASHNEENSVGGKK